MYSVIRRRQEDLFRARTIGTDKTNGVSAPNFHKVAECFGIQYIRIETSTELREKLNMAFSTEGALLCEIHAVEDQEYLCDAYGRNAQKRLVHRPIEDLYPFIDRELFLSEMLVEPIDQ